MLDNLAQARLISPGIIIKKSMLATRVLLVIICANSLIAFNMWYTAANYYQTGDVNQGVSQLLSFVILALSTWQYYVYTLCRNNPSAIVVGLFSYMLISPVVLFPFFTRFDIGSNSFLIITLFFSIHIIIYLSRFAIKIRTIKNNQQIFSATLSILLCIGAVQLVSSFGSIMSVDWASIYDRRLLARDIFSESIFLRYYNSFLGGVLIPFCALYGLVYRSWVLIALTIIGAALSFAAFGGKGVLFSPLLALLLGIYFLKSIRVPFFLIITFLILLFVLLCVIEIITMDSGILNMYAFRRVFYVPAKHTYLYWEYFSNNPVYLMSDSVVGSLFGGIEQEHAKSRLIGEVYYGSFITNANVNIFGTAFGDFGTAGMPLVSALVGIVCMFINGIYYAKRSIIIVAYTVFVALVWTQGGFHTAFLSNGLIFSLVLLTMIPKARSLRFGE